MNNKNIIVIYYIFFLRYCITEIIMSMDAIPEGLRYSSISSSQARVIRQRIQPIGINQGSTGTVVRWMLPQKSIIDMRSLAFHYDYTISGLTDDAVNYSNCHAANGCKGGCCRSAFWL